MARGELAEYLIEAVEEAIGPITSRRMFGSIGIWKDGVFVAMISDGALSIRLDEAGESEYLKLGFVPNDPRRLGRAGSVTTRCRQMSSRTPRSSRVGSKGR